MAENPGLKMATLTELTDYRNSLLNALGNGVLRVRDQNGEMVEYRSTQEIQRAIAVVDNEIRKLGRQNNPVKIIPNKGL